MNRIKLLSEQVANQIAAGEVVERPASVVKELVENALDAHSTKIQVDIQAGGRSLIRVTDDGGGMNRDDALLCLERHATSKIRKAEDLASIATMGFRGEALPSIASVSRMTLTTREQDDTSGEATQLVINGGKLVDVKSAGGPPGTSVEVRQLFFNLPARRKFLRSEETEYGHIHHYLTLVALAYPHVGFSFIKDGRSIWKLPPAAVNDSPSGKVAALLERMRQLSGRDDRLLPLDDTGPLGQPAEPSPDEPSPAPPPVLRVWGVIGPPGVARSSRQDQHLFVNLRPVENRGLNFALIEGYHTSLMKGRYPVCTIFLELDPSLVDVNIHPAKREVKFHRERAVRQRVSDAVRQRLLEYHSRPAGIPTPTAPPTTHHASPIPEGSSDSPQDLPNLHGGREHGPAIIRPKDTPPTHPEPAPAPMVDARLPAPEPTTEQAPRLSSRLTAPPPQAPAEMPPPPGTPTPLLNVPLRLVGVIGKLYVVLESDRGLVLLDQHAAHERILFEQLLQRLEQQEDAASQRLLLPETVELSVRDAQFLRDQLPTLTRMGVGLSEFGERTFLLDAVPPLVKVSESRSFVLELLDELKAAGDKVNTLRLGEHTIAKTVCRQAVKANDYLAGPELENLVRDLRHCDMPYTCPHGRPTLIEMSFRELEKKFGRVT